MARSILDINGIEGVVTGGIAVGNIPTGQRLHVLKIFTSSTGKPTAVENVDWVRISVDGVVMRDLTATEIINIAKLNGITPASDELPIYFSEPWRASVTGEEATSWDLAGVRKVTLEAKLKTGLTGLSFKAKVSRDFGRNITDKGVPYLSIVKQLSQAYNAPSGQYDVTGISTLAPIQRIHFTPSAGDVTALEVTRDGEKVFEATDAENAAFLRDYKLTPPDANAFNLVFDHEQQVSSALVVNRLLHVKVTSSAANVLRVLVESRVPGYV
jgi:hypothetical protein